MADCSNLVRREIAHGRGLHLRNGNVHLFIHEKQTIAVCVDLMKRHDVGVGAPLQAGEAVAGRTRGLFHGNDVVRQLFFMGDDSAALVFLIHCVVFCPGRSAMEEFVATGWDGWERPGLSALFPLKRLRIDRYRETRIVPMLDLWGLWYL